MAQLRKRYNTYNYNDRLIKSYLCQTSNYIQITIDTLIAQGLSYRDSTIQTFQEINSYISLPYDMSPKTIRNNLTKIAKILDEAKFPEALERKITNELSRVDILCEQNQVYERETTSYNYNIYHFFYPLKVLFSKPSR